MKVQLTDTTRREIVQMTLQEKILLVAWISAMMTSFVPFKDDADDFDPEEDSELGEDSFL
jgi:hypothetical protein